MSSTQPHLFITIALAFSLAGCGDSRINEMRSEFLDGCKSSGAKKAICSCIFDKIQEKYTKDQILDMKTGVIPQDFPEFNAQATLNCIKNN